MRGGESKKRKSYKKSFYQLFYFIEREIFRSCLSSKHYTVVQLQAIVSRHNTFFGSKTF